MRRLYVLAAISSVLAGLSGSALADEPFSICLPPGGPTAGWTNFDRNELPGMLFPLRNPPAYIGSVRGQRWNGNDPENYTYPWRDTFCAPSAAANDLCRGRKGNTGLDIRPSLNDQGRAVVAVSGGIVDTDTRTPTSEGALSLTSVDFENVVFIYGNLERAQPLTMSDRILENTNLGHVAPVASNGAGGYLHFTVMMADDASKLTYPAPPFRSLVDAYQSLTGVTSYSRVVCPR